ncbi:MAG: alpha/beta hydrolase [Betaproteobacteria bacterium]|nr:alpha/beta hydrolase [Betaproteobacteria bacterium]
MNLSVSETLDAYGVKLHVRRWGDPSAPTLFLLHGWMDVSASFQFVADELLAYRPWNLIAPDWRGFGPSEWLGKPYSFPDHLADLEILLDHYSPNEKARIVGHSMGGIIACLYAGLRPHRVERLVSLEGVGIPPATPDMAPQRFREWLDTCSTCPAMYRYPSREAFIERLMRDDPFLGPERAAFLAGHLVIPKSDAEAGFVWAGDPWHRAPSWNLHHLEDSMAIWREIATPVLWVTGRESWIVKDFAGRPGDWEARRACYAQVEEAWIENSGHMLHHDQPEEVARLVENFFP